MTKKLLITIIATATLLRIISLGQGDLTGSDEIFYGFRAIGMLDFDHAPKQTTPLEWFDQNNLKNRTVDYPPANKLPPEITDVPRWTHLSFSDHPPLVFLIQHWFMRVFGEYKFAFRLPSALAGIFSVFLVYLIGKKLFSANAGLIAATLLAVTVNAVHNSRLGLQEPILILLMLAAAYFFLRADENRKYLLLSGGFWGLAMLAKYNAIILAPIFLTYILISKRSWLSSGGKVKYTLLSLLIALAIFSPVIVYNLELYRSVGHFDFQFSYLLRQNPEIWQSAPGKAEAGTLLNRITGFIPALAKANSWPFLLLSAVGLLWLTRRYQKAKDKSALFLTTGAYWIIALIILVIGPTPRFLSMLTPWLALAAGALIAYLWKGQSRIAMALFAILLAFELAYTINTDLLPYPVGPKHFAYSRLRYENYRWGYNELDDFLASELSGKYPLFVLNQPYKFLDKSIDASLVAAKTRNNQPYSAIIVYDNNTQNAGRLWSFNRLQTYHGWPTMKVEDFLEVQKLDLPAHTTYFVEPTDKVILKPIGLLTDAGLKMEQFLIKKGIIPTLIKNQRGEPAFRVYKF